MFIAVNSLKQLQILVTKLTSFSDPIMQITLTSMYLNRTMRTVVEWDFIRLYIYLQWEILVRLFEIYVVAIQFSVTWRNYFAFHKSEFGGPSNIRVKLSLAQPYVYRAAWFSERLLKGSPTTSTFRLSIEKIFFG